MSQARSSGYFVKALYVRVPARTAIARAAMRKRGVKPERVHAYYEKMKSAMAVAAEHADEVEIIDVTFDDAPAPGTMHGWGICPASNHCRTSSFASQHRICCSWGSKMV